MPRDLIEHNVTVLANVIFFIRFLMLFGRIVTGMM